MRGKRKRTTRLLLAALLALSAITVSIAPTSAAPGVDASKHRLEVAKTKLVDLNSKFTQLVEDFNFARYQLSLTQEKLVAAQATVDKASAVAQDAQDALATRAVAAYQGGTSSAIDMLLGSQDFTEFTYRLEFLNQMAANDADLASEAQVTGEEAHRAAEDLQALKAEQQKQADSLASAKDLVAKNISAQKKLVSKFQNQYDQALAAQQAALRAAQQAAAAAAAGSTTSGSTGAFVPVSSGAAGAIEAARSQTGKPYVWGSADPNVGFDCSGLTMWSWAQVGVSLPHSSAAQYSVLPHVSRDQLQPGDLLFFYTPIHHVAMYTGGNMMIHASNPGVPVQEISIPDYWWALFVGAARPG
jgi:cell wall-associated NlpC family hydrolase